MIFDNAADFAVRFRTLTAMTLVIASPLITSATNAVAQEQEMQLGPAFAFADRFPEASAKLGFVEGVSLAIGTLIRFDEEKGDPIEIVRATASNGSAEFELESISLGFLQGWQALPAPLFMPEAHTGVWTVTVEDANGTVRTADAVPLDHGKTIPFVENIEAKMLESGELQVGWTTPDLSAFADLCSGYTYRLRLLRDFDRQLFRSGAVAHEEGETAYSTTVPPDKVTGMGDLQDIWARVELQCRDSEAPGAETRSNAFAALSGLVTP